MVSIIIIKEAIIRRMYYFITQTI